MITPQPAFLPSIHLNREEAAGRDRYPFNIPAVRNLHTLELHPAVTFFVGENGTGKSTLLEAVAVKLGFNPEGGSKNFNFETRATHSELHHFLRIERAFGTRATDGFFLRSESFYNVATQVEALGVSGYGDKLLHEQSHGEAFVSLLTNRLQGEGIYIFDEPEAALSPSRQLSVLSYLHRLVYHHSQLIIATHSPILLAYPLASIYSFSETGIKKIAYEETEHYRITKMFLDRREHMIDLLLREEEADLKQTER